MKRPLSFFRRCVNALPLRFRETRPAPSKRRPSIIPQIEILEDRLAPAITGQGANFWINPNTTYTGTLANFSDTDSNATFTASVNYGDGNTDNSPTITPDPNGGFDVLANHSYATAGTFQLTITLHDSDGNSLQLTCNANVANSYTQTNSLVQGNWQGTFGTDGYDLSQGAASLPSYATVSLANNSNYTWTSTSSDARALAQPSTTNRLAACWYSSTSFTIDVNLTDGQAHAVGLYALDWDDYGGGRSERIDVLNADTNQLLDSETISNFQNGKYLVWSLSGNVEFQITNLNSNSNAVVSGLFFGANLPTGPSGSASFVGTDTTVQGSWQGAYGTDGYDLSQGAASLPSYASLNVANNSNYTWTSTSSDARALAQPSTSDRLAACWYSSSSFDIDVNTTDGQSHLVGLYALDWDNYAGGRSERIDVLDANTGTVLDSESISSFQNGEYLVWNVSGNVVFQVTNLNAASNAVISGVFFGVANPGVVQGTVFDDLPGSGQLQSSDPGLAGWTVQLLNSSNQVIAAATTNSTGAYSFLDLAPGTYSVQEVLQAGYTQTATPGNPITVSGSGASFGNFQDITISGTVFDDTNGDGQQQISEAGIPNETVQLYTASGGVVSAEPLQTTSTDAYGNYQFANLGPLSAGTSYVVAQEPPANTTQTTPSGSNSITLPDGRIGWLVPATGGVAVNIAGQAPLSGTGFYTLNKLNNSTTATITYNDGQGDSGSLAVYLSQFNVTFSNGVDPPTFNTFCIDLKDRVGVGGTYPVAVQPSLTPTYANAGRMADIFQEFGEGDLSDNPVQAAAVQIAEWDLSINDHDPTYFTKDPDGSYSSGDPSVFSVKNFSLSPADTFACVALVNEYLALSVGSTVSGAFLQTTGSGQSLLLDRLPYSFGISREVPNLAPGCG